LAPLGVTRVGTVDKFQGYSCTASSPQDAPVGMAFLYDPHRFNVATSRARGAIIAEPSLTSSRSASEGQIARCAVN
jgi:uncharacterized protein